MKKKGLLASIAVIVAVTVTVFCGFQEKTLAYEASDDGTIHTGVYADTIDLSGMTAEEAMQAVNNYVEGLKNTTISLNAVEGNAITVSANSLGLTWTNKEIIDQAVGLGREGNIVERYKALKDIEHENKVFAIEISFNQGAVQSIVSEQGTKFDRDAVNATIKRTDEEFEIVPGENGMVVDVDKSVSTIMSTLGTKWDKQTNSADLVVEVTEPRGNAEDLAEVKDVLGSYTTSFKTSAKGRSANVKNGCRLINGKVLYPGEQFSVYESVSPFSEENGYYLAGSYLNGLVVESLGGGICQVSSTLYNAVIRSELTVDERFNHSMVVSYVDLSADAAISGTYKDFKFTNTLEYPIYIEGSTTEDKKITFTIYGKETRPENRSISFESETIEQIPPVGEKVVADATQPVGYVNTQAEHIGYKAKYWKIVKVDGVETDRILLNNSSYMAAPKTATVGTVGDATGAMAAAVSTQNIEYCKAIAASLLGADNGVAAAQAQAVAAAQAAATAAAADAAQGN